MSGYGPLIRWDQGARIASAWCNHCPFAAPNTTIARVRTHVLVNPSHRVTVTTTSIMDFTHATPHVTATVG